MPAFDPEALARWSGGEWTRRPPGCVQGIGHDTRALTAGCLYVALKGARFDGHDFVGTAFDRGAAAALVDRAWPETPSSACVARPLLRVDDTGRALAAMAAAYRRRRAPRVAGVTGSMGKTTVKDMLADMLGRVRETARSRGNWNNAVGLPLSLLAMSETAQAGVFELGVNHPGEMAPLCAILQPDTGMVTNIAPVHIEHFECLEAIAEEKAELLRSLPNDGVAVLNRDSACFERLRACAPCRVTTVSLTGDADYRCVADHAVRGEAAIVDGASAGETWRFRMRVPGTHVAMNAALAAAMARAMDVPWPEIVAALEAFTPAPMRWETIEAGGVRLINDAYNANPDSMRAAIRTFAGLEPARGRWLILGDMLELGAAAEAEHQTLGAWLTDWDWRGLIAVGVLGGRVADGAVEAGFDAARVFRCRDATEAARTMTERIGGGDTALLKASRGLHLEDAVRKWASALT